MSYLSLRCRRRNEDVIEEVTAFGFVLVSQRDRRHAVHGEKIVDERVVRACGGAVVNGYADIPYSVVALEVGNLGR